jgi:hypothetical protein
VQQQNRKLGRTAYFVIKLVRALVVLLTRFAAPWKDKTYLMDKTSISKAYAGLTSLWFRRRLFTSASGSVFLESVKDRPPSEKEAASQAHLHRMEVFEGETNRKVQNKLFTMTVAMLRNEEFIAGLDKKVQFSARIDRRRKFEGMTD